MSYLEDKISEKRVPNLHSFLDHTLSSDVGRYHCRIGNTVKPASAENLGEQWSVEAPRLLSSFTRLSDSWTGPAAQSWRAKHATWPRNAL